MTQCITFAKCQAACSMYCWTICVDNVHFGGIPDIYKVLSVSLRCAFLMVLASCLVQNFWNPKQSKPPQYGLKGLSSLITSHPSCPQHMPVNLKAKLAHKMACWPLAMHAWQTLYCLGSSETSSTRKSAKGG